MTSKPSFRFFYALVFLLVAVYCRVNAPPKAKADDVKRYGAVLIRESLGAIDDEGQLLESEPTPSVVVSESDRARGWRVLCGEAFTGVDARRFYFTVEAPNANISPPTVDILWKDVKIARVLGAKDGFSEIDGGVRLVPTSAQAPTGSFTEISLGSVKLGVFHNWKIRRCGPYRDGRYPQEEIDAHLNYMAGALEVFRAYGWTENAAPDFVDHIDLYGFETHFPNGHRDFPPHFHIMLAWDGWAAAQVGHYLLSPEGKIVKNSFWSLHKDIERSDLPTIPTPYYDKTDKLIFETVVLEDGSGLIINRPDDAREYLIRAGQGGAYKSVEVCERSRSVQNASPTWQKQCEVETIDDVANGRFCAKAVYEDGSVQKVEFLYDPDTGALLKNL